MRFSATQCSTCRVLGAEYNDHPFCQPLQTSYGVLDRCCEILGDGCRDASTNAIGHFDSRYEMIESPPTTLPAELGFRSGARGTHTSRTMMLSELASVLETMPGGASLDGGPHSARIVGPFGEGRGGCRGAQTVVVYSEPTP